MRTKIFSIKILIVIALLILSLAQNSDSQISTIHRQSGSFYFDAICYQANNNFDGKLNLIAFIPYQLLSFEKSNNKFISQFELIIDIRDSNDKKIKSETIKKQVFAENYFISHGGTGEFIKILKSYYLNSGKFSIELTLIDDISGKSSAKSREITVIPFKKYDFSLSGIMLVSSIEENNGKYKITPHIEDNIAMLKKGFFIFFELYNRVPDRKTVDFIYEIIDAKNQIIKKSNKFTENVNKETTRHYLKVNFPRNADQGSYKIKLIALKHSDSSDYSEQDYLAITERSIKFYRKMSGYYVKDIDQAIKYLRYVANQSDIEYIEAGTNKAEKQKRFEEFWKSLDPSPNTERNEAFDEYFSRIAYANKHFKSYNQGWLTDMGMIYIVFGPPDYINQTTSQYGQAVYIKWTYLNGREFVFVDSSGLKDYRLARTFPITEKYHYKK